MKLVSLSHLPKNTNATMHACNARRKDHSGQSLSISLGVGRCLPLDGANADLEPGMKTKKKRPKSSGIFSGPSLAYADRDRKGKERKMQSTPRPVPLMNPFHISFIMPLNHSLVCHAMPRARPCMPAPLCHALPCQTFVQFPVWLGDVGRRCVCTCVNGDDDDGGDAYGQLNERSEKGKTVCFERKRRWTL